MRESPQDVLKIIVSQDGTRYAHLRSGMIMKLEGKASRQEVDQLLLEERAKQVKQVYRAVVGK